MWPDRTRAPGYHGQTGRRRNIAEHKAAQPVPRTGRMETDGPQKGKGVSG